MYTALFVFCILVFPTFAVEQTAEPALAKLCPPEGSSVKPVVRELNKLKNRATPPATTPAHPLSAFLAPGDDEERWNETEGASVTGYVLHVKPGGIETCNCGATDLAERDTHIEIGLTPDAKPNQRMIVEISPRWRKAMAAKGVDWSTPTLEKTLKGKMVRVSGWLLWDIEHVGSAENTNPGNKANWRATCWEAHPITSLELIDTPTPKAAEPVPAPTPTVADILKTREEIAKLVAKEAAQVAALNADLKKLGIAPVEATGIGRPGKDGHSPVLTWGTGADADRIAIDGKFTGPHLTGPQGPPAPGPVVPVDPFAQAIADAFAATPEAEKPLVASLAAVWSNEAANLNSETTTQDVITTLIVGRKLKIGDGQLRALRTLIDTELGRTWDADNPTQPKKLTLTADIRAVTKTYMTKVSDLLSKLK